MGERLVAKGTFDVPDVVAWIPRRVKPWLFVVFVLIVQFSGGVYLAAATDMVGDKALMQEDILMAGYASLMGMAINFAVMFRVKFRFSTRTQLLSACIVLIVANIICAFTDSVALMVAVCFVAGWFRMQATFACNSTIQLWLTPYRDMSVFFCYVYIVVDGVIQLCGIAAVYSAFAMQWQYMHWGIILSLVVMMIAVMVLIKPVRCPMFIPLLGIDWMGSLLWSVFMLCFTFVCVYGNYYDWWASEEIVGATIIGTAVVLINLWRATFLHHPYISFQAMANGNVVRASIVYIVFFTLMATEHVFEHTYAGVILGFDSTNLIDMNWWVLAGVVSGVAFTYFTFALRKWRYKTMTVIGFAMACVYLGWFYFSIDYGVEKEAFALPLFCRGAASVIISIVFLTFIVQSGLPFMVFPQALTINGFMGAVVGATLGPALIGEFFSHTLAKNFETLGFWATDSSGWASHMPKGELYGMIQSQAVLETMKEIYGWLLIGGLMSLLFLVLSYKGVRPSAIFPTWRTIRRTVRHAVRIVARERDMKAEMQ